MGHSATGIHGSCSATRFCSSTSIFIRWSGSYTPVAWSTRAS
ncbi:hypothetical protein O1L60_30640 [Streptomyces diastatochromogenes]|nr:hypothetical protein [Streptomyces diastatochromogenes]